MLMTLSGRYPLISILIPAYNHAKYISTCLDSIVADGYPNLEVIVLDDGSIDDTHDLAVEWFHRNGSNFSSYHVIRQKNQGIAKSLNTLLRNFSGEYFVLLASDDMLLEGGVEARLIALKDTPKALAIFADAICIDECGRGICDSVLAEKFEASLVALSNPRTLPYELILNWCIPGPVYMAKREVVEIIGYYNEKFLIEDRDYYLRLIAKNSLTFVNRKVAAYRLHGAASTGTRERQVRIGQEVMRIEMHNLTRFHGLKRIALWLALKGNATNFRLTKGIRLIAKIFLTTISRCLAVTLKYFARVVAHVQIKYLQ